MSSKKELVYVIDIENLGNLGKYFHKPLYENMGNLFKIVALKVEDKNVFLNRPVGDRMVLYHVSLADNIFELKDVRLSSFKESSCFNFFDYYDAIISQMNLGEYFEILSYYSELKMVGFSKCDIHSVLMDKFSEHDYSLVKK